MSLFDGTFAFDSAPCSPSSASSTSDSTSSLLLAPSGDPANDSMSYPRPSFSVTDLAAQFASQCIQRDAQMCYDPCASYANTSDSDADWAIPSFDDSECAIIDDDTTRLPPPSRSATFPLQTSSFSASRRAQRQRGTRMLCTAAHRRDLAELMARMVASNTQCYTTESSPPSPIEDEDEDSCGTTTSRTSRNSRLRATPDSYSHSGAGTGACVQKNVRSRRNRASRHAYGSGGGSAS